MANHKRKPVQRRGYCQACGCSHLSRRKLGNGHIIIVCANCGRWTDSKEAS